MAELLAFAIPSGILLLTLFLAYRLFIAGEKQHVLNRFVILGINFVSFALPLVLPWFGDGVVRQISSEAVSLPAVITISTPEPSWLMVLLWVYTISMAAVILDAVYTTLKIMWFIRHCRKMPYGRFTLALTERTDISPFSWYRYMVMSSADFERNGDIITCHELQHLRRCHWIDLIIAQCVTALQWFNPAAWLLRKELMSVHEFQADSGVLDSGFDIVRYQQLLIRKAVGTRFPSLTNSLNYTNLKIRFNMMYSKNSSALRSLRTLALLPALLLAIAATAMPQVQKAVGTIGTSSLTAQKATPALKVTSDSAAVAASNNVSASALVIRGGNAETTSTNVSVQGDKVTVSETVNGQTKTTEYTIDRTKMSDNSVYIVNGQQLSQEEIEQIPSDSIAAITVKRDDGKSILINGRQMSQQEASQMQSNQIQSMTVVKNGQPTCW